MDGSPVAQASLLEEIRARMSALPADRQREVAALAGAVTGTMRMVPNAGPQTAAYRSMADVLLYGGQAGGGKTFLELGWPINESDSGIIFRRELTQTDGLEKEGKKLIGQAAGYNGTKHEWTWPNGKSLKLAGMKGPEDWQPYAGRERDYMGFDEGGEFLEVQVASIIAWLRAAPGKRCRVIIGSNPPRSSDGQWLLKWFAPWLDERFDNPAEAGELRWACYVTTNGIGAMQWVAGPGEYQFDGENYTAKSYTFIPASLADNPYRNTPEYKAQLQSLPEPLRSQLLYGDFGAGLQDGADQMIPTAWIRAAQKRWTPEPPKGVPMCAMGVDASGGGEDPMVIAARYDGWYAELIETPGATIPGDKLGTHQAGVVVMHRRDSALVIVDMGGGYGGGIYEHLKGNGIETTAYKGAGEGAGRSADRQLKFHNMRTQTYWRFREALDPDQPGGSPIALPPDPGIVAELAAVTFDIVSLAGGMGVKARKKETVIEKLGHSPNKADAIVMAWTAGVKMSNIRGGWRANAAPVNVVMGHAATRRTSSGGGVVYRGGGGEHG
jgi:hypothetical protein